MSYNTTDAITTQFRIIKISKISLGKGRNI